MRADRLPGQGASRAAPPRATWGRWILARPSLPGLVGLLVVLAFFALQAPDLIRAEGIADVLDTAALLGIGGAAVALLLVAGQFDLSVGMVALASSAMTALLIDSAGWGTWPALAASFAAALVVGLVNGMLVVNTGLPSFLVTLATFLVLQGTTLAGLHALSGSPRIDALDDAAGWSSAASVFGSTARLGDGVFRVSVVWWLGVTAVATWVLWRTKFGNAVFASGGARTAARELGVPVRRTTTALFCLSATAGWLIGTLGLLQRAEVEVSGAGLAMGIDFIVVAVLGGCLLVGGYGSAFGASIGALLYAVSQQGIERAGWDAPWFQALLGVLLVVALLANGVAGHRLKGVPRS